MVIASEAQSPGWLHTLGQIAGTILLIELLLVLLIVAALMVGFAIAAWWAHKQIVPVLREQSPKALQAMAVAESSSDRLVRGIAEFYGRRQGVQTGVRVLLFGKKAAQQVHNEEALHVSEELQRIAAGDEPGQPGPENGYTPRPRSRAATRPLARAASAEEEHGRPRETADGEANRAAHTYDNRNGHSGNYDRTDLLAGNAG